MSFAGAISAVRKNGPPPQLHEIEIAINRNGHINPAACRDAVYGFVGGQKVTSTLNRTCKAEG